MDALKAAIAQVRVGSSRGTGFLVSDDGLVLTALHVVANRELSLQQKKLVAYPGEVRLRFGDPKNNATRSPPGPAVIDLERYGIEDDWALLRVAPPPGVAPLPLARLAAPQKGRGFETFGFPDQEADVGGAYAGTIVAWDEKSELTSPQILAGAPMGGISGAPCVVGGRVVAMIVQALLNDQRRAVKPSLYAITIEKAARGAHLPWDDAELPFEAEVRAALPTDPATLLAAARLGLPEPQAQVEGVARRLLQSRITPEATYCLGRCAVAPTVAARVLEYVAAMQLRQEAVARLTAAAEALAPALLRAGEERVARWYARRARYARMGPDLWLDLTVVVPPPAGDEEAPAGGDLAQSAAAVVEAIGEAARRRWPGLARMVKKRLSSARVPGAEFGVVLRDELRFDVVEAVRARLPNAHLVVVTADEVALRDEDLARITPVTPALTPDEEERLLTDWEIAQSALGLSLETA